jgi:4'-phosphopantetheinyl transferase EntD
VIDLVAHCGANWKYCDGGSVAGGIFMLWLIRRSVKRAERKARQRRDERLAARAVAEIVAKQQEEKDPPALL